MGTANPESINETQTTETTGVPGVGELSENTNPSLADEAEKLKTLFVSCEEWVKEQGEELLEKLETLPEEVKKLVNKVLDVVGYPKKD